MNRLLLSALFFIIFLNQTSLHLSASDSEGFTIDIRYLESLYPCGENSESENKAYNYIKQILKENNIVYSEPALDSYRGTHSFNKNIVVDYPGSGSDNTFILAVPLNNYSDNQHNIASGLYAARYFNDNRSLINIKIIFLGSEFSETLQLGTEVFLQDFFPEAAVSLLYLNISGYFKGVEIFSGTSSGNSPYWLIKRYIDAFENNNINYKIDIWKSILYKIGYDRKTPTVPYLRENIPSVYIKADSSIRIDDIMNIISEAGIIDADSLTEEWEHNYQLINRGGRYIIIKEKTYLIFYISVVIILLFFSVLYVKHFLRYLAILRRYFWVLPYLFILIFIFLLASTAAVYILVNLKGLPEIWEKTPLLIFAVKILTSLVFLFSSLFILRKIKLPHSASFYSSGAIFLSLINLVIFQFLDITLSFLTLWSLLWIFLFSFIKNRKLKTICIIISQLFIIYITYYIFKLPAYNLANLLLNTPVAGNILSALVLLPLIIMILRVTFTRKHIQSRRYSILRKLFYALIFTAAAGLSFYYYKTPLYSEKELQPVLVSTLINDDLNETEIIFRSPVPIGLINASVGQNIYFIDTGKPTYSIQSSRVPSGLIEINIEDSFFLDRKNVVFEIVTAGKPSNIEISYKTENQHFIYDSNYPFTPSGNLTEGAFHIGRNPPTPVILDLLVNRETVVNLEIKVIYEDNIPFESKFTGTNMKFAEKVIVTKSING